jgi:Methylase involved in ubiquinone/menaquinone biosynthesis
MIPRDQLPEAPKKNAYVFLKYSYPSRWASYFYQLREVLNLNPESVLEVGVGDRVFGSYLLNNSNVQYKSVDFSEDLHPDIVGSVTKLPVSDESFDLVCAFEVLEHVPFEYFETALKELARVSKKNVVLSLPHFGPSVQLLLKIPLLPKIQFAIKIPFAKRHIFNGRHYWEIGKRNYSLSRIVFILEKYFIVKKQFVPFENQYHHFFVLEKK